MDRTAEAEAQNWRTRRAARDNARFDREFDRPGQRPWVPDASDLEEGECDVCGEVVTTTFRDHNREAYPLHLELTGQQHLLFKAGERVELVSTTDRYTKLEPGSRGTVLAVRGRGAYSEPAILVAWDDGSTLAMLADTGDAIRRVGTPAPSRPPNDRSVVDGPTPCGRPLTTRSNREATS